MFQARPISLKTEVWDRITNFLNEEAAKNRGVMQNTAEFIEEAIVAYLDAKTAHIERIIKTIQTQIEKLRELRKTLINDVVTGKIKVV